MFTKKAVVASLGFLLCIVGANWAISQFGVVPVGFGLMAPAGVYFAGLSFGLRDLIQESGGRSLVLSMILTGAIISYMISDGSSIPGGYTSIALASFLAFLFSETADFLVYTPLRERNLNVAVVSSNLVGAVIDSILFLVLAFGSLEFFWGQIVGKAWMTIPAIVFVNYYKNKKR